VAPQSSVKPITQSLASCDSLLKLPVVARATWDRPGTELLVVGDRVGEGESDYSFEVINAELLLIATEGPSLLARVPLGELTRVVSDADQTSSTDILELSIQALGEMEQLDQAVAFEYASLPDTGHVLLVHLMRDVQWGLTERYAVIVTIRGNTLIAGDRVLVGRDALEHPVFYGVFELSETESDVSPLLVLRREGMGHFSKRLVFQLDDTGAFRSTEELDE
ncbi:MAG: hypothetical protein ABIF77_15535, partial [bacterium]